MYVTAENAALLGVVAYAAGILTGAGLVAFALARREASLSRWAAALQLRERGATDSAGEAGPSAWPVRTRDYASPVAASLSGPGYRWPVLPDALTFPSLASFLVSTRQPVPLPDTWR